MTDFVIHLQGQNPEKGHYTSDGLYHSHRETGRYTTDGLLHLHAEGANGLCSAGGLFIHTQRGPGRYTLMDIFIHTTEETIAIQLMDIFHKHTQSEWRVPLTTDGLLRPHRGNGRCASDGLSFSSADTPTS